ncbi:adenosine kinase [Eurytemora carolleeae]|uniref:adenosine kinase n=1 Tax=Eurytemora carolleeae TaxID=1294199 RepID=UPI000C7846B7|nr:adenosine kinase [Eurytemora carolleeae]|eukprot:XP_023347757.1 adenosine kinase-like [Eurytemora affinis]
MNSARVYQWLAQEPGQAALLGGVGADQGGRILQKFLNNSGVVSYLAEHSDLPTGHCIALVQGPERTLGKFKGIVCNTITTPPSYLHTGHCTDLVQGPERTLGLNTVLNSEVVYVEGYFLIHSPEVTCKLAQLSHKHNKKFVFNLCGEYVCENIEFVQQVLQLFPYINFLFGNRSEFKAFLRTAQENNIYSPILQKLNKVESTESSNIQCTNNLSNDNYLIAVVTEGSEKVSLHFIPPEADSKTTADSSLTADIYSSAADLPAESSPSDLISTPDLSPTFKSKSTTDSCSISFPVPPVPESEIQDTIAAGDSFIAGFIYTLIHRGTLDHCVKNAIWTAQKMIRQSGSSLPSTLPDLPEAQCRLPKNPSNLLSPKKKGVPMEKAKKSLKIKS